MADVITLVIGLPGSGKTMMFAQAPGVVLDDIHDISQLPQSGSFVVIDHFFCDAKVLFAAETMLHARYPNHEIVKIFFENDPKQCLKNAALRDRAVDGEICRLTSIYNPPNDAIPVWRES